MDFALLVRVLQRNRTNRMYVCLYIYGKEEREKEREREKEGERERDYYVW